MFKRDKARLKRLAWKHAAFCRCPLKSYDCDCTEFEIAGFERLFKQLCIEMVAAKKLKVDEVDSAKIW